MQLTVEHAEVAHFATNRTGNGADIQDILLNLKQARGTCDMISRPPLPDNLEVYIESYDPQGRTTYVSGRFALDNSSLRYEAILMDEYGGPNVSVTLPDETAAELSKRGFDYDAVDELITAIQRKIMEGAAHVELKETPPKSDPGKK